jgi:hypothetical protein
MQKTITSQTNGERGKNHKKHYLENIELSRHRGAVRSPTRFRQ